MDYAMKRYKWVIDISRNEFILIATISNEIDFEKFYLKTNLGDFYSEEEIYKDSRIFEQIKCNFDLAKRSIWEIEQFFIRYKNQAHRNEFLKIILDSKQLILLDDTNLSNEINKARVKFDSKYNNTMLEDIVNSNDYLSIG